MTKRPAPVAALSAKADGAAPPRVSSCSWHEHAAGRSQLGNQAIRRLLESGPARPELAISQPDDPTEREADSKAERVAAGAKDFDSLERKPLHPASGLHGESVSPAFHSTGVPMDRASRAYMESRFSVDFSSVRIHTDTPSEQAARSVNAHAFTVGTDIVFAAGRYAPDTLEGRRLLAHELTHVVQQSGEGGRPAKPLALARAIDPSKAEPIKKELDSLVPFNSTLQTLWASLGVDLPDAINDTRPVTVTNGKNGRKESYRDLWWRSVLDEKIDLSEAGKPLLEAFASDTISVARAHLSSQLIRLEALQDELKNAARQTTTAAPPIASTPGGVADPAKAVSRITKPKPVANARGLIDTATLVHFLYNWEDILRTVAVGVRRVDTSGLLRPPGLPPSTADFAPFPNSPASKSGSPQAEPSTDASPQAGFQPMLFDPSVPADRLVALPNVEFVDLTALAAIQKIHQECSEKRATFRELIDALLAEDASLAVLAERGELSAVSALSIHSDAQASAALANVAKNNADAARKFLNMLGKPEVDWKDLRPIHAYLLGGGGGGSRNWSNLTARGFVENYFKQRTKAAQDAAERQLILNIGIGAVTFIALLSPAAPLAAAVLIATEAYAVSNAVTAIGESIAADKRADVMAAGADAQVVNKDDARRAKEHAEAKRTAMAVDILMAALPYLPKFAKGGASVASALGRELRWERMAARVDRLGAGPMVGDLVIDLAKAGVSAIARNAAGGALSLNYMVSRIRAIQRTLAMSRVGTALARGGDESLLHLGSKYGLEDYIRYHIHGPGLGREAYPIFLAPTRANQFVNNHVEGFMRRHRDAGALVDFSVSYVTHSGTELRPFLESMLRSGDATIIGRLALDQGLVEKFLKSATYDIRVTQAGQTSRYMANVTVGAPGSSVLTTLPPQLVR